MQKFQELSCFRFTYFTHFHPSNTKKCILYLAENSVLLHHKDQPVNAAHENNHSLLTAQHIKQTHRVGKTQSLYLILKQVVHIITTMRHGVNTGKRLTAGFHNKTKFA
jgi:hypothetical protein